MARRLCNALAVGLLLTTPLVGWGQATADGQQARMWAATASYVYHDDPDLKAVVGKLDNTIHGESLRAFGSGLAEAVATEKRELNGQKDLEKFQSLFTGLQQQQLNAAELSTAIIARLSENKKRMDNPVRKQQLSLLEAKLSQLATTAAAPVAPAAPLANAATPETTAALVAVPAAVPAAPTAPLPTPWMQWLALGLAALSLGGLALLAVLWGKVGGLAQRLDRHRQKLDELKATVGANPVLSGAQIRQEVQRQLAATQPPVAPAAVAPAPAAPVAAAPAPALTAPAEALAAAPILVPAAPPAPRVRRQYVSEAPLNRVLRAPADQPGPYSIFEVESTEEQPGEGRFTITGNQLNHIQNHRLVLEPVCEYVGGFPQGGETRLLVDQPGQVRRTPDGNWEVTQPARVRFGA